jgi:hypothetical protein
MTKEQLELIKELIVASVKGHEQDPTVHRRARYVLKRTYDEKIRRIQQKLLDTCEEEE